jgi:pimeloyl-ACP methyl ester carboxylesterase
MSIPNSVLPHTSIRRVEADGVTVFYREAGPADAPVVLLLHGFPTSSFQYRDLIPRLPDRYRVIAPDNPTRLSSSWILDALRSKPTWRKSPSQCAIFCKSCRPTRKVRNSCFFDSGQIRSHALLTIDYEGHIRRAPDFFGFFYCLLS